MELDKYIVESYGPQVVTLLEQYKPQVEAVMESFKGFKVEDAFRMCPLS